MSPASQKHCSAGVNVRNLGCTPLARISAIWNTEPHGQRKRRRASACEASVRAPARRLVRRCRRQPQRALARCTSSQPQPRPWRACAQIPAKTERRHSKRLRSAARARACVQTSATRLGCLLREDARRCILSLVAAGAEVQQHVVGVHLQRDVLRSRRCECATRQSHRTLAPAPPRSLACSLTLRNIASAPSTSPRCCGSDTKHQARGVDGDATGTRAVQQARAPASRRRYLGALQTRCSASPAQRASARSEGEQARRCTWDGGRQRRRAGGQAVRRVNPHAPCWPAAAASSAPVS
jgi:hypothetical protein